VCVGAKDQSNYLVAGFNRNFSQESCTLNKKKKLKNLVLAGKAND